MADKEFVGRIAATVEDAGATWDEELEWTRHREPAKIPTAVCSARVPVDRIAKVRRLAADRDVQPTALLRTWVLVQVDAARSPEGYVQRGCGWVQRVGCEERSHSGWSFWGGR